MQSEWANLKTAIERALKSAEKGERGGLRVHCGSAERMLKGAKTPEGKDVAGKVHSAMTSIDLKHAVEHLEAALAIATAKV
mgnify:CR=1 FL=1